MTFAATLVACAVALAPVQDTVNLERKYKAGETDRYALTADLEMGGANARATALIAVKVLKELKEGQAEAEMTAEKFSMSMDDNEMGGDPPAKFSTKLDRHGLPEQLHVRDESWIYALLSFAAYAPGQAVKDQSFKIDWQTKDGNLKVRGSGKLIELQEEGGEKIAVIKYTVNVKPEGEDEGDLEYTSKISVSSGKLVSCEGKVAIGSDGMGAKYTIKREKPEKQ
jgi:hypothetical protein